MVDGKEPLYCCDVVRKSLINLMRYFFISFSHYKHLEDGSTVFGDGYITMQCETFPNKKGIELTIKETEPGVENITIMNIIELSEQDYKDFIEE